MPMRRKKIGGRHLRGGVEQPVMEREAADPTQPIGGETRTRGWLAQGPINGDSRCDVRDAAPVKKVRKLDQRIFGSPKLEPERSTECKIVGGSLSQRRHCTPPGQEGAMARREVKSTLA
jgi:hypothetical protein